MVGKAGTGMYMAIRSYKYKAGAFDQINKAVESGFVSIVSKAPGFIAYHLVNTGNNTLATVSLFESQAGADESTRMAADWVRENLAALVEGPPEVKAGEVTVHKMR
jgi:heme-degrading monooxygenase HmoA